MYINETTLLYITYIHISFTDLNGAKQELILLFWLGIMV